jgi:hypothetical protein
MKIYFFVPFLLIFIIQYGHSQTSSTVLISWDPDTPLQTVLPTYLSVNIDSGSLNQLFDFNDPILQTLTTNLVHAAPTQLRIGGGAADDLAFTGINGISGPCNFSTNINVCVNASYMTSILNFADITGIQLVFDLNAAIRLNDDPKNAWNSTNAELLFEFLSNSPNADTIIAFQLGNEPEDWYKRNPPINITGSNLAADYATLQSLLTKYPTLTSTVYGPDACCESRRAILEDFTIAASKTTPPLVSAVTVHEYPISRALNDSCLPDLFISKAAITSLTPSLLDYASKSTALTNLKVPLILGETATSAHGGCNNLSNVFVSGFTFIYELGSVGESPNFVQLNRQDLAGFSSQSEPSNYGLIGSPGWKSGDILPPHPDYFTALLFKYLVSTVVMNSSYASMDDPVGIELGVDIHAWCGRIGGGIVILTYFNLLSHSVNISLPTSATSNRRNEYILTATSSSSSFNFDQRDMESGVSSPPPPELYQNNIYLNGELLSVNDDGTLPTWPFPGRPMPADSHPIIVPAYSYGFIELLDAGAAGACTGC